MLLFPGTHSHPRIFPGLNIFTVMIERQPVVIAIVLAAVFTEKRQIDAFTADHAVLV